MHWRMKYAKRVEKRPVRILLNEEIAMNLISIHGSYLLANLVIFFNFQLVKATRNSNFEEMSKRRLN